MTKQFVLVLVALIVLLVAGQAAAQSDPAACFPPCRAGFVCQTGQCVSACNPPCPEGELCSPAGACVSACNPPCAGGETCTSDGRCTPPAATPPTAPNAATAPTVPATTGSTPLGAPPPTSGVAPPPASPGWARGAAIFGYASGVVILAGTAGVIAFNDPSIQDKADFARGLGMATTVYLAVADPIVAVGGASARKHPGVVGAPGLRIVSWVGYGLAILDATFLIALSYEAEISNAHILSVGMLGAFSAVGFGLDAQFCANEAEAIRDATPPAVTLPALRLQPMLGMARTMPGGRVPLLGIRGSF